MPKKKGGHADHTNSSTFCLQLLSVSTEVYIVNVFKPGECEMDVLCNYYSQQLNLDSLQHFYRGDCNTPA